MSSLTEILSESCQKVIDYFNPEYRLPEYESLSLTIKVGLGYLHGKNVIKVICSSDDVIYSEKKKNLVDVVLLKGLPRSSVVGCLEKGALIYDPQKNRDVNTIYQMAKKATLLLHRFLRNEDKLDINTVHYCWTIISTIKRVCEEPLDKVRESYTKQFGENVFKEIRKMRVWDPKGIKEIADWFSQAESAIPNDESWMQREQARILNRHFGLTIDLPLRESKLEKAIFDLELTPPPTAEGTGVPQGAEASTPVPVKLQEVFLIFNSSPPHQLGEELNYNPVEGAQKRLQLIKLIENSSKFKLIITNSTQFLGELPEPGT